jgi:hypothetical protein
MSIPSWARPEAAIKDLRRFDWKSYVHRKRQEQTRDPCQLIFKAVTATTYRGFRGLTPSATFRPWALEVVTGHQYEMLAVISDQAQFDAWLARLGGDLERRWKKEQHEYIRCGPKYKLLDLLIRMLCEWPEMPEEVCLALVHFVHVPLDKYVLGALRGCVRSFDGKDIIGLIPESPGMGFVRDYEMYMALQCGIRGWADAAGVPPIALDYLLDASGADRARRGSGSP